MNTFIAVIPAPPPYDDCLMTVVYRKRRACNMYDDVQVVEIQFAGNDCGDLNTWLNDPNTPMALKGQFMGQAQNLAGVGAITQEFTMKYNLADPPTRESMKCPNGTSIWRISRGSCWYVDRIGCEVPVMKSCPNEACCLQNFTLCMGTEGVQIQLGNIIQPAVPCGAPEHPGTCATYAADGKCYFECDNDGLEDLIPPGRAHPGVDPEISESPTRPKGGDEEAHLITK